MAKFTILVILLFFPALTTSGRIRKDYLDPISTRVSYQKSRKLIINPNHPIDRKIYRFRVRSQNFTLTTARNFTDLNNTVLKDAPPISREGNKTVLLKKVLNKVVNSSMHDMVKKLTFSLQKFLKNVKQSPEKSKKLHSLLFQRNSPPKPTDKSKISHSAESSDSKKLPPKNMDEKSPKFEVTPIEEDLSEPNFWSAIFEDLLVPKEKMLQAETNPDSQAGEDSANHQAGYEDEIFNGTVEGEPTPDEESIVYSVDGNATVADEENETESISEIDHEISLATTDHPATTSTSTVAMFTTENSTTQPSKIGQIPGGKTSNFGSTEKESSTPSTASTGVVPSRSEYPAPTLISSEDSITQPAIISRAGFVFLKKSTNPRKSFLPTQTPTQKLFTGLSTDMSDKTEKKFPGRWSGLGEKGLERKIHREAPYQLGENEDDFVLKGNDFGTLKGTTTPINFLSTYRSSVLIGSTSGPSGSLEKFITQRNVMIASTTAPSVGLDNFPTSIRPLKISTSVNFGTQKSPEPTEYFEATTTRASTTKEFKTLSTTVPTTEYLQTQPKTKASTTDQMSTQMAITSTDYQLELQPTNTPATGNTETQTTTTGQFPTQKGVRFLVTGAPNKKKAPEPLPSKEKGKDGQKKGIWLPSPLLLQTVLISGIAGFCILLFAVFGISLACHKTKRKKVFDENIRIVPPPFSGPLQGKGLPRQSPLWPGEGEGRPFYYSSSLGAPLSADRALDSLTAAPSTIDSHSPLSSSHLSSDTAVLY